jgi:predicted membrane protein
MMIAGGFKLISGIIGLFRDEWLVLGYQGYLLVDTTGLAIWWLCVGVVLLFGGMAALRGERWGEVIGIIAAALAAISEFFMIPYFPIWSILLLVVYVIVLIAFIKAPASED